WVRGGSGEEQRTSGGSAEDQRVRGGSGEEQRTSGGSAEDGWPSVAGVAAGRRPASGTSTPAADRRPASTEPADDLQAPRAAADRRPGPRTEASGVVPPAVVGVGVAMPGPLDHRAGVPGRVTGFPEWDGYPLRDELARRLGMPVELDKDTNAAALGLALRSPAADSFAYVHLGTGLGAGLVLGGRLLRGARTGAGEFGHQTVRLDGPPCDCGGHGCLEVLCLAAVARGDLAEAARVLGTGAANLVRLLDIDRVLLGGRSVLAAPAAFADGAHRVLAGLGLPVPVSVAGTPHTVAEGAAQLILSALFGK
ncbi:ROK family protein, partial [Streptomyces sp. NPDC053755]|uniref:ROK family protein n=1 Tax=Streptomyces sp. NPDC053755 TaxID=3155815 RepID=UPI003422A329